MEIPTPRDLRPLRSAVGSPPCVALLTRVFHRAPLLDFLLSSAADGSAPAILIPPKVRQAAQTFAYFALRDDTRYASLSAPSVRGEVCHGFSYRFFATAPWIDRFPLEGMQARIARCPDVATR